MSVEVRINGDVRSLESADAQWIARSINGRKHDDVPVSVVVTVKEPGIDLVLSTPSGSTGGGGRLPNARERSLFEMWDHHKLNDSDTKVGELVSFLRDLTHFL